MLDNKKAAGVCEPQAAHQSLDTQHYITTSPADVLLPRLSKLQKTGRGQWIACCPGHDDRSPSLSIRELDDGRLLLHCFAGCDVSAVVGAVGLALSDLFPPRDNFSDPHVGTKPVRAPFSAMDVLRALRHETLIAALAAKQVIQGNPLSDYDLERLLQAYARLDEGVKLAGGHHAR